MADSSQCPSAETLALLPDGRASSRLRLSMMVHLDGCTHCRRVLAYTGQYEASQKPGPTPHENARTAFRIGVQLAGLRAGIEEGQRMDAAAALRALRSLSGPEVLSARWSPLEEAAPKCLAREHFLEEIGDLEGELSRRLDPPALALGRWAEASRLAAASRNRRFFAEPYFERMLSSLDEQHLFHQIRAYAKAPPSRIDLKGLERALRRLILLF